jgi:hypothetical protein
MENVYLALEICLILQLEHVHVFSVPGTLATGMAGAHFGKKKQIALKNKAVE